MKTNARMKKGLVRVAVLVLFAALVLPEAVFSATDGSGCSPQFPKQPPKVTRDCH